MDLFRAAVDAVIYQGRKGLGPDSHALKMCPQGNGQDKVPHIVIVFDAVDKASNVSDVVHHPIKGSEKNPLVLHDLEGFFDMLFQYGRYPAVELLRDRIDPGIAIGGTGVLYDPEQLLVTVLAGT